MPPASKRSATTASTGSTISQPASFAVAMIARAVSAISFSQREMPMALPWA